MPKPQSVSRVIPTTSHPGIEPMEKIDAARQTLAIVEEVGVESSLPLTVVKKVGFGSLAGTEESLGVSL